jgi:hypothetical protein
VEVANILNVGMDERRGGRVLREEILLRCLVGYVHV